MNLCDSAEIKALLARHRFRFSKALGQNFLIDERVPEMIAEASGGTSASGVLEIGPGIGPLTCQLALRAGKVVAVELDRALLPVLAETMAGYDNVKILHGDILKLDIPAIVREHLSGLEPIACANLPYQITTPAITALLESGQFGSITVMIQREVARRICAVPGTSDYGAFSVFCQFHASCNALFDVPPEAFMPAPKVTSSVIRLIPRNAPPADVEDEKFFFRVVRAAFSQRRKTLLNSLSSAFGGGSKQKLRAAIAESGLDPGVRGERLGIAEYAALAKTLKSYGF